MAREVYGFEVTVPAGTTKAAPQVTDLAMPPREVEKIEVKVPSGPRGKVGFQLGAAKAPTLPINPSHWVVVDNDTIEWSLEDQLDSGAWQMFAYNTGNYPHTIYIRFLVRLPSLPGARGLQPIPAAQLSLSA